MWCPVAITRLARRSTWASSISTWVKQYLGVCDILSGFPRDRGWRGLLVEERRCAAGTNRHDRDWHSAPGNSCRRGNGWWRSAGSGRGPCCWRAFGGWLYLRVVDSRAKGGVEPFEPRPESASEVIGLADVVADRRERFSPQGRPRGRFGTARSPDDRRRGCWRRLGAEGGIRQLPPNEASELLVPSQTFASPAEPTGDDTVDEIDEGVCRTGAVAVAEPPAGSRVTPSRAS